MKVIQTNNAIKLREENRRTIILKEETGYFVIFQRLITSEEKECGINPICTLKRDKIVQTVIPLTKDGILSLSLAISEFAVNFLIDKNSPK